MSPGFGNEQTHHAKAPCVEVSRKPARVGAAKPAGEPAIVDQLGFSAQGPIATSSGGYAARPMIPSKIVIDTQVVMDWLVFREPSIAILVEAIQAGQVTWIGTAEMKAELLHVLGRGIAADRQPDLAAIDDAFARWCQLVAPAPPKDLRLVCRDPDDQMFIDLAVSSSARWLISRDRAVLALAKRANKLCGLAIQKPEVWIEAWAESQP